MVSGGIRQYKKKIQRLGEGRFNLSDKTKLTLGFRSYDQDTMVDAKDGYFGVFDGVDKVFNSSDSGVVPKVTAHNLNNMYVSWNIF